MACKKCASNNISDRGVCRPCHAAKMREWSSKNKEKKLATDRAFRIANFEELRKKSRERAKKNRTRNRLRSKRWYEANKERSALNAKISTARRRASDPEKFKAAIAARVKRRRLINPRRYFYEKMSRLVSKTLKRHRTSKQGKSWPGLVGYTIDELEARLLETMPDGYCWADYLSGALEIDHIVPASAHNFASPLDIDFRRCWALSNLRLLTKEANYEKRAKLSAPFQPALLLASPRGAAV